MDFKKLAERLANPYWSPRHPSTYTTAGESGPDVRVGPGVWFQKTKPSDRELWNMLWAVHPELDAAAGFTRQQAMHVVTATVDIARVGALQVKLEHDTTPFTLVELSNLIPLEHFTPVFLNYPQRIPSWMKAGLSKRIQWSLP